MGEPIRNRTRRIIEKSNDDTDFLERQIETQINLLTETGRVMGDLYDNLVEAQALLEDENIDDIFSIADMKSDGMRS